MNLDNLKSLFPEISKKKEVLNSWVKTHDKIILIGNGGSNAISSHISVDYTKCLGKKAFSFSDAPLLTAYINDYGKDEAYKQFLLDFADSNTFVILISSSGDSMNIVNAAHYCETNKIPFAALSGFNKKNKLNNTKANFKFHVNFNSYGVVELAHEILLHSIVNN